MIVCVHGSIHFCELNLSWPNCLEILKLTLCSSFLTLVDCIILPVTAINHQSFLTLAEGTHLVAARMSLGSQFGGGKSLRISYCQLFCVETGGPACSVLSSWRHSWVLGKGLFQGAVKKTYLLIKKNIKKPPEQEHHSCFWKGRFGQVVCLCAVVGNDVKNVKSCIIGMARFL